MRVNAHEILSGIRTVTDMAKAFRDESHCRSLLGSSGLAQWSHLPLLWLSQVNRTRRSRSGQTVKTGTVPMFQQRLPVSVYSNDTYTASFNQASFTNVADWIVAHPSVRQRYLIHSLGRGPRHQSTSSLAHGTCPALAGCPERPIWRHD